ncbi:predicted protein [Postia placenta Mad-698-R]|uniref:Uncharacterized protein n=1 Tax=Postia placenta MAD-698-R-SB12 TaxID=670580 RepID=A0A1X6N1X4_9APHY|nr:hypothetical protein POSPLADRAFT_1141989 [Postia placenta MAD-698-R-SB12]EED82428.1 predicted protein [Postia placenta Mad-698-R]OSX62617.1 hypothetical protein POSPLADRAFT_1141989 [Postia placenta MAD-698-R-SB12]
MLSAGGLSGVILTVCINKEDKWKTKNVLIMEFWTLWRHTKQLVKLMGAAPEVQTSTAGPGLAGLARASSQRSQDLLEGLHRALAWLGLTYPGLAWPGSGF